MRQVKGLLGLFMCQLLRPIFSLAFNQPGQVHEGEDAWKAGSNHLYRVALSQSKRSPQSFVAVYELMKALL